ncbi:hypothetical protein GK047_28665 [Paenibacillus sp. SYP-B3998]|uniref:Uncharacterized protein n=1 Tax=Paenibacillus sp. SYP-B3998 TaxID=2678564 RepID=A0A6G4A8C7_9BACL|nr:hypothetical protein [Paenibacillus sp. SYP-B3998]NEW09877.1 hypothetical protein [Paenibacillus sp. SYP-B3998]
MDLRIRGAQTTLQQAVSLPCGGASARLNSGALRPHAARAAEHCATSASGSRSTD